jgi:wyosine [tRNA(Phe)-imidazoG37] synthetase (radical SAM superfamily)
MKHIFGPVNSRRLGLSLGIDLLPPKICNFNCIYCEIGPTTEFTCERREYVPTATILGEIDAFLAESAAVARLDVFTITASGEPTLHTGIGAIIHHLKDRSAKPVAVLTNGSLLHDPQVQQDLRAADIVIPSLDAAREASYRKINRPAACAPLDLVIDGLIRFRAEFRGQYWLEILLAKGINDSPEDLAALRETVARINPTKVQLNTVARPPLESFARPLSGEELRATARYFTVPVEIIVDFTVREREKFQPADESAILAMLRRRPCTAADVAEALNLETARAEQVLEQMVAKGQLTKTAHHHKEYYQPRKA